ncbi:hypothetical protein SERLA73DRAFT_88892 [Serpula lacrymans var. lacrymans S7.3]|uniref:Pentatricopeptide repeat-containing protein-mitochondrial domain-containing protein n=2 Tax=Serpula lacrymans var. lacrymans TaxID=341189 RepID=F8PUY3_SERL3|nr:hypothetical protein SERLA73DRAFT_88892 [Serpula lacrymans var. lacrymans S7.3]
MARLGEMGRFADCLRLCKSMKNQNIQPTLLIYNSMLAAGSRDGFITEAWGIFEDMISMGIQPDRQSFHHLIHASRHQPSQYMWDVLHKMEGMDISPNEHTYGLIIERFTAASQLELALQFMNEMGNRGFPPELPTAQSMIKLAAQQSFPRLALDLAENFEATSVRRLDTETWMTCLHSSSEVLYAEGVLRCWQKLVQELKVVPGEGACLEVLQTAGRHGLPDLATDVIRVLRMMGVEWQEWHFAPLIESFCKVQKLKEAFGTLDIMRSNGIHPVAETTQPIFKAIAKDIDNVDGAWEILDELRNEGKVIDATAINTVIQAAISLGDLQRAVGAYKAFPDYGSKPNIETFNLLLSGCIAASHRELGNRLLLELKEASIKPDARTYERIIILCLTQASYEDAFFYLEEMKAQKFLPPISVYDSIIRTCVANGDARYSLALDEMKQCGYEVSRDLQRFISSGGKSNADIIRQARREGQQQSSS